ncbi:C2 calcium-dependent domain-containing protein 4C [Pungitius pungitius]|uniref:C2 calcium-dependent domain-containing protein 4C n=1 Tax=Pungitius pungitius TaxID=134920 RepID=UPI002E0D61FE
MWVFEKISQNVESIPLKLSHYLGKNEEDVSNSSEGRLSYHLHRNILSPDTIPEFCLPPRLRKRSPLPEAETASPHLRCRLQMPRSSTSSNTPQDAKTKDGQRKDGDASVVWKATKKPLPFCAEGYGLAGIHESPNTRRKESLFHSKCPIYTFDRSLPTPLPRPPKATNLPKKTSSGVFPLFSFKSASETASTGRETPSSSKSSALSSVYTAKSSLYFPPGSRQLKGATSCPSLNDGRLDKGKWERVGLSLTKLPGSSPSLKGSSATLASPVLLPLDVLKCQETHQHEHVLPLQGRGKVRLFAEQSTSSTNTSPFLSTVRVFVVSVEGLWDDTDRQNLSCAVNLSLTPGKLQQQKSATISNCRSPVFNEDFFFTELSREDLLELQLRLKVVCKPAAGALRGGTVIGMTTEPLFQLLSLRRLTNVV